MARILLAASETLSAPVMRAALAGHELLEPKDLHEAERLIQEASIELFVIGVQFDDSRGMELVKRIRLDQAHKKTPILIVRVTPSEMASFIRQTMDTMKSLGVISDYLELEGDPLAEVKIRDEVSKFLQRRKTFSQSKHKDRTSKTD